MFHWVSDSGFNRLPENSSLLTGSTLSAFSKGYSMTPKAVSVDDKHVVLWTLGILKKRKDLSYPFFTVRIELLK
jgi:hypothetical protein